MNSLENKKVLMFAPHFFNYEIEIADKIKEKCNTCIFYDERCEPSTFEKICIRLNYKKFISKKINNYYNNIINSHNFNEFDYVLFFNPETITVELLKSLKYKQQKAIFVLYMWDSFKNKPHTQKLLPYFDKKFSFNKIDCIDFNMKFRPLFYIDKYDSDKNNNIYRTIDIDIGFVGTIHSDRYQILEKIRFVAENLGLKVNYYMFFPNKLLFYKYKISNIFLQKIKKQDFVFKPLTSSSVLEYLSRCKTVIDIQHPKQTGLTMRTIEMLGLRKKLITTNNEIRNYDFYNNDNICIIDRKEIKFDNNFFKSDYNYFTDKFRNFYSLDFFISELLE